VKFRLPLNDSETARLYWELERRGASCSGRRQPWSYRRLSGEDILVLALLQSRYDPRLAAILVDFFKSPHPDLNPVTFKEELRGAGALAIAAVVGEFVNALNPPFRVRELFGFLMSGASPMPTQLFYRGLYPLGSKKMGDATSQPLWGFKKWGFLAADPPFLKENDFPRRCYLFDSDSRSNMLQELAAERKRFTLQNYLVKIRSSISRQQALKDLNAAPGILKKGKGKGTYYCATG